MKKVLLVSLLALLALGGYAKKNKSSSPVCGAWKYEKSSVINDFQRISNQSPYKDAKTELLVFNENNEFKHDFIDKDNHIYKTLTGKWKIVGDKIKITYTDIDFQLTLNYFFIDKDLVLGQNFNHIIFTKDVLNTNADDNLKYASVGSYKKN